MATPARGLATLTRLLALAGGFAAVPAALHAGVVVNDCGWLEFTTIPGVSNAPDNVHTRIYQTLYSVGPGHETVLRGWPPLGRFWSFAVLDASVREVANLSDVDIHLDGNGAYEVVVKPDCTGETRDCLAVGEAPVEDGPEIFYPSGRLFYRIYLPEADERGGVPLPAIEYRTSAGGEPEIALPLDGDACAAALLGAERPLRADGEVGELLNRPSGLERPVAAPGPDPVVRRYDGIAGGQFESAEQQLLGLGAPPEAIAVIEDARRRLGGGATADNGYVTVVFNMNMGNLELRAKAPSYRLTTAPGANGLGRNDGSEQVRYWSFCTTQEARPVDCLHDEQVTLDSDASGFFTIVVAPSCPQAGYANCLRAGVVNATGGAAIDTLLYRNLLAADGFGNEHGPPACPFTGSGPEGIDSEFCGDYALQAHYKSRP